MPGTVLVSRLGKGGRGAEAGEVSVFKNIVKKTKPNRTLIITTTKLSGSPERISQARKQAHVTRGRVLVQGLQDGKTGPGSEGEQVFTTEGWGRGRVYPGEGAACAKAGDWKALVSG